MNRKVIKKKIVLIAGDSERNRSILADMLSEEFKIIEAANGAQIFDVIRTRKAKIDLILLDMVMPEMDGFEVLERMNEHRWMDEIPVVLVLGEQTPSHIERAYDLGVTDCVNRPFDAFILRRRADNAIRLHAKQKKTACLTERKDSETEKDDQRLIHIFGHVIEFPSGKDSLHVLRLNIVTELLLKRLLQKEECPLSRAGAYLVSKASALHDIGKVAIPLEILNKPGKLTREEFEIMKTHARKGASMLQNLPFYQNDPLVQVAYEICLWHHERYDGGGYPDGLKGEEIPVSAQIVSLADVYAALTSGRVYQMAYSHEKAIAMILNGECGAFHPLLLECLMEVEHDVLLQLETEYQDRNSQGELIQNKEWSVSERTLRFLEQERNKYLFFASTSNEIQFEFTCSPPMITISEWGARKLGLDEVIQDPAHDTRLLDVMGEAQFRELADALCRTTPEEPMVQYICEIKVEGKPRWHQCTCRTMWSSEEPPQYMGAIGKAMDIHEERLQLDELRHRADHDSLTGLPNRSNGQKRIQKLMAQHPNGNFALALFDIDYFKHINDCYGHLFGDRVLQHIADQMRQNIRSEDIAARVGGDEFLIFLTYQTDLEKIIRRIFNALNGSCEGVPISVSMGVACTERAGKEYDILFQCADRALYAGKRQGRGRYLFYDESMEHLFSALSSIRDLGETKDEEETKGPTDC
ncbi:MAG: diguanylate cyclase domain-containing protein [Oscillospiraceae bacterium]|jgi:diguanylate cyclase (GGDEF)-like protein